MHLSAKQKPYWRKLQQQKVITRYDYHAARMIGTSFFVDENGHVIVDGFRYSTMLEDYFWPELDELDM